jgi:hypothetical protein
LPEVALQAEGVCAVAYESKILLAALASVVRKSKTVKEVYSELEKIANVEGVILEPYEENEDNTKDNAPQR